MLRIGIVAGEPSGDELGATLIAAIKKKYPDVIVEGIGGEKLISEGCRSLFDMERLSVMGLFEILGRYFELLGIQKKIKQYFIKHPPDIFIGIDAPDFNLSIEKHLKKHGIKTVHYVSPSVWAWREGRLKTIKQAVDLILTLFPFEENYYKKHNIPVKFVGHPLAHHISMYNDSEEARKLLKFDVKSPMLALLPGSRRSEISRLTEPFIKAAISLKQTIPDLQISVALRDDKAKQFFESIAKDLLQNIELTIITGKTQNVIQAADCVLLASGTATLETMLIKRPMVVAYKANPFTYWLIKPLLKIPYVSLPNLIAGKKLVPEFLQNDCTPENLAESLFIYFNDYSNKERIKQEFTKLHESLILNDPNDAKDAVINLLEHNA